MDPRTAEAAGGASFSALGVFSALLAQNYGGVPVWLVLIGITTSLAFGMLVYTSRAFSNLRDGIKWGAINFGALWVMAFTLTFSAQLAPLNALMLSLAIGVAGPRALRWLEHKFFGDLTGRNGK